VYEIRS